MIVVTYSGAASGSFNLNVPGDQCSFPTPGTYSVTFNQVCVLRVRGVAGGGGGGAAGNLNNYAGTAGSAGAADPAGELVTINPAATYTVEVGNGGIGGASLAVDGTDGQLSRFRITASTIYLQLAPGVGGSHGIPGDSGGTAGGVVTVGTGFAGGRGGRGGYSPVFGDPNAPGAAGTLVAGGASGGGGGGCACADGGATAGGNGGANGSGTPGQVGETNTGTEEDGGYGAPGIGVVVAGDTFARGAGGRGGGGVSPGSALTYNAGGTATDGQQGIITFELVSIIAPYFKGVMADYYPRHNQQVIKGF